MDSCIPEVAEYSKNSPFGKMMMVDNTHQEIGHTPRRNHFLCIGTRQLCAQSLPRFISNTPLGRGLPETPDDVSPAPKHLWHHVLMVPVTNAPAVPSAEAIAAFCRKWQIVEFSLFGSILRGDFSPGSDVDILVDLAPDAPWSL